ncbi:MAG: PASTA domain-containing protein [Calditrichia bacterium]
MNFLQKIKDSTAWQKFLAMRWWQKSLTLFALMLVFTLFMDFLAMPWYTRLGKEYELPDVTEKTLDEAIDILEGSGFIPIIQDSVFDSDRPTGIIVRQNPQSFSTVKKGRRVYLVKSNGEKPIYMPNLTTMTKQNAEFKLKELGLKLGRIVEQFSRAHPYKGTVISQSELPGDLVSQRTEINIVLSLGPPPSQRTLPNLVGKTLNNVREELSVLGVDVNAIRMQYQPRLVPNTVVSQSIPGGTNLRDLKSIDLVVSTDQQPDYQN